MKLHKKMKKKIRVKFLLDDRPFSQTVCVVCAIYIVYFVYFFFYNFAHTLSQDTCEISAREACEIFHLHFTWHTPCVRVSTCAIPICMYVCETLLYVSALCLLCILCILCMLCMLCILYVWCTQGVCNIVRVKYILL